MHTVSCIFIIFCWPIFDRVLIGERTEEGNDASHALPNMHECQALHGFDIYLSVTDECAHLCKLQ